MEIEILAPDIEQFSEVFGERRIRQVIASSMNEAMTRAKTPIVKAVTEEWNVKPTAVRKSILIRRALPKDLLGVIVATARKAPYIDFRGTRQTGVHRGNKPSAKGGVTVYVRRNKPQRIRHAFIQTMPSGHKGVFLRYGEKRIMSKGRYAPRGGRTVIKRQPIKELYGPAVSELIDNPEVIREIIAFFDKQFPGILEAKMFNAMEKEVRALQVLRPQ